MASRDLPATRLSTNDDERSDDARLQLLHALLDSLASDASSDGVVLHARGSNGACLVISVDKDDPVPTVSLVTADAVAVLDARVQSALWQAGASAAPSDGELPDGADASVLTRRQLEVLALVARGYPPKEIAPMLGITTHTCRDHIKRAREQLGCTSVWQVIVEAMRRGWLPAPER